MYNNLFIVSDNGFCGKYKRNTYTYIFYGLILLLLLLFSNQFIFIFFTLAHFFNPVHFFLYKIKQALGGLGPNKLK